VGILQDLDKGNVIFQNVWKLREFPRIPYNKKRVHESNTPKEIFFNYAYVDLMNLLWYVFSKVSVKFSFRW